MIISLKHILKRLEGPKYKDGTHVSIWGLLTRVEHSKFDWNHGVFTYKLKGGRTYVAESSLVAFKKREKKPNEFQ